MTEGKVSIYTLALTFIPNIGAVSAKNLISYCGGIEEIFKTPLKKLLSIPGIGEIRAKQIRSTEVLQRAEEELLFIEKNNIHVISTLDDFYPYRLKLCTDGPVVLFYKGNVEALKQRMVSVIGTRHATDYGKASTEKIVQGLKGREVTIVSGLAYGIDIAAHKASLENHIPTIAVLGHGLDMLYPAVHRKIAERMLASGGLLTEFPSGTKPDRENFPKRNRIVAGISEATVVVETANKGGSMITASMANSYNRDVFALPGPIHAPYSQGCHYLIKHNMASLMDNVEDLIESLGWGETKSTTAVQTSLFTELSADERLLIEFISSHQDIAIDDLTKQINMPVSRIAELILGLELQGVIKTLPGKRYRVF